MLIIAVILSDIMCATVAYQYRDMLCGIEHSGYSAPADVAFLCGIPYILGIITCFIEKLARTPPPQLLSRWGMNCVIPITTCFIMQKVL